MKRKRCEMEETMKKRKMTEIGSAIEELSVLSIAKTTIVTTETESTNIINLPLKPLLSFCRLIIQVLDKIGPTMAVLRQDIDQNIQRLETMWESDPILYSNLVEILRKEAKEGSSRKPKSCSRAALWLTRAMDFTLALLQRLVKDMSQNMEQAVEESYNLTIKPWHGWISSAAFKVALKLVPNNNTFINVLSAKDESVENDISSLISLLIPLLSQLHSILESYEVDKLKST
uniref:Pleckstrin homology domain-containing family A member 8 n=1 Tax=Noccaea caerulescens TaxID=107243 RepID=A0A1J3D1V1_NOCCA